jgi:hypothetical protein
MLVHERVSDVCVVPCINLDPYVGILMGSLCCYPHFHRQQMWVDALSFVGAHECRFHI